MRLTPLGESLFNTIEKNTVPFVPNYNEEKIEPMFLPALFPNLICNGSLGIGVGLSSNILPHNLKEVCDGLLATLENPTISINDLMTYIPGPDFPTGGTLIADNLSDIYTFGKGSVKIRSKYKLTKEDGRDVIVITEIPYLVTVEDRIIKRIQTLIEDGYEGVFDVINNIGKNVFEIHIIVNKGFRVNEVLEYLFDKTPLEVTLKINHTVNANGNFITKGLREMLRDHIAAQHTYIINAAKFDIKKAEKRKHLLDGLVVALEDIDNVIHIIKTSSNKQTASLALQSKYLLDSEQAEYILDTKLSRLTSLEVETVKNEIKQLIETIAKLMELITDEKKREVIIRNSIQELKNKYGDERRTSLSSPEIEEKMTEEEVLVFVNGEDYKTIRTSSIPTGNKGTKGVQVLTKEPFTSFIAAKNTDKLCTINEKGVLKPLSIKRENGKVFGKIVKMDETKNFVLTVTKNGYVKKTPAAEYSWKKETQLCKIKDGDSLFFAALVNNEDYLYMSGVKGSICVQVENIKQTTKLTLGNNTKTVISSCDVTNGSILVMDGNKGKIVNTHTEGSITMPNLVFLNVEEHENVYFASGDGKVLKLPIDTVSVKTITGSPAKLYNSEKFQISSN